MISFWDPLFGETAIYPYRVSEHTPVLRNANLGPEAVDDKPPGDLCGLLQTLHKAPKPKTRNPKAS